MILGFEAAKLITQCASLLSELKSSLYAQYLFYWDNVVMLVLTKKFFLLIVNLSVMGIMV
jgi:hypothetical protein